MREIQTLATKFLDDRIRAEVVLVNFHGSDLRWIVTGLVVVNPSRIILVRGVLATIAKMPYSKPTGPAAAHIVQRPWHLLQRKLLSVSIWVLETHIDADPSQNC